MQLWEVFALRVHPRHRRRWAAARAWLTGRATARTWSPWWKLVLYVVLLTIALRFIHFSLFEGTFFLPPSHFWTALHFAAIDFVVLMIAAAAGRQVTRAGQMARQYGFLSRGRRSRLRRHKPHRRTARLTFHETRIFPQKNRLNCAPGGAFMLRRPVSGPPDGNLGPVVQNMRETS